MGDIDYGAVFGVGEIGEKEQETAEPATETDAQGEKEQETAEPAETGNKTDSAESEGAEDTAGDEDEQNARFAAARRKAEAERDAAIQKARQDAAAEAAGIIDRAFAESGLVNPYTKKPIVSKAEFDEYRQRYGSEIKDRMLKNSGMSDEEFEAFVHDLPEVRAANEAKAAAERAQADAREAAARVKVDEQLKEIGALDPSIRELSDLMKLPTYKQFYELVQRGNNFVDAYKLANFDQLTGKAVAASKQAAINAAQSKGHMNQTQSRGAGAVTVPTDVKEMYLAFNPTATEAEIQAHYARSHKK